jgi:lysophospholipase L1-like esterase
VSNAPDRSRPLATALLLLASIAFVFVGAELITRLLWRPPVSRPAETPEEWRSLPELRTMFELMKPSVRGIFSGVLYENNSAGFRGPERSLNKLPGVFRIVAAGDSVTMGAGVVSEDTYAAGLERTLAELGPEHRFEVLNIGLGGLNGRQVMARLQQLGLPYDPDLVVYGYTLNDIEGRYYRQTREFSLDDWMPFADSPLYLLRVLGPRWLSFRELVWRPRGSYIYELDDNYLHNPAAWGDVTLALDRFAALTRRRGVCGVLLLHTHIHFLHAFHPFKRLYEQVGEAAESRGIHVAPSFHRYQGKRAADLWVSVVDTHPNPEGHILLKEALLDGLERLPEACWRGASPFADPGQSST